MSRTEFDKHRLILKAIDDAVAVIDTQQQMVYVNEAFEKLYGVTGADVIGRRCKDVIQGEMCGGDDCLFNCRLQEEEGAARSVHNVYCREQRIGPLCVSSNLLHDDQGQVTGVVEVHKDMSILGEYIEEIERTREQILREQRNQETILSGIADGVFTVDESLRITGMNNKCLRMLGKRREDVIGETCCSLFRSDTCDMDCPIRWAMENNKNVVDYRERILGAGDRTVEVLKSAFLIRDPEDRSRKVIGVIRDISEYAELKTAASQRYKFFGLVSKNPRMQEVFRLVDTISSSDTTVMITGESGTGKELIANAIQENSLRRRKPYVKINCSALTETLLESELFGHEKGAFTGAIQEKKGKFEAADGGTLFLDEVGDMSLGLQAKVLRVLQESEFQRVGGHRTIKVDVRILAATNKDLKQEISNGRFREDIYYRLCVIPIHLSPLRERREDIALLVHHFMEAFRQKYRKQIAEISERALHMLTEYRWPGNVRELQNVIEYAFVCCNEQRIRREHFPVEIRKSVPGSPSFERDADGVARDTGSERERIVERLLEFGGNRNLAAQALGMSRTTLWRRMKQLGIKEKLT